MLKKLTGGEQELEIEGAGGRGNLIDRKSSDELMLESSLVLELLEILRPYSILILAR